MSEFANNLLDAIVSGEQEQMNAAFSDAMNAKINDSLQARKIELAQRIYGDAVQDHSSDIDDADISDEASDNGTEEV
jgi:uncharacterized protein (DUF1786 family)